MRRAASAASVVAAAAGMLAVPVLARPVAVAHAVAPHIVMLAVRPNAASHGVLGQTSLGHTRPFELVGATWRRTGDAGATTIQVRVHQDGRWSGWHDLAPEDGGADGGSADAQRAARLVGTKIAAEPLYVGPSDGAQARVVGVGRMPASLRLVLVDGGRSAADANPRPAHVWGGSVANAEADQPTIYTRADWGADESLRRSACPSGPSYSPTIKMGFVHHTDTGNGYSRSDVPSIIRSIYAYHVRANGWCDVGYNYLVDRFGRIWEGRYGGITQPVLGAHTGGFNYDSFGVSLIGSFSSATPSAAMLTATEQLFAWRLGGYYLDPLGTSTMIADSFSGSRYSAGSTVRFKTVSGHRDADLTTCPGNGAYADLGDIRSGIRDAMGAGFVAPAVSATTARMGDGTIEVTAGAITGQTWTLTVTDATGVVVRTITGSASRTTGVDAVWDLTDDVAAPVLPGTYTLTLTGADAAGASALPWTTTVSVTPPVTLTVPPQTGLGDAVVATGRGIPGHTVDLTVDTSTGQQSIGAFAVTDQGTWSAAPSVVDAGSDLTWTVTDPALSSFVRTRTTRVAPTVTSPTGRTVFVRAGTVVALRGTALPASNATVAVMTTPLSGGPTTTSPAVPVDSAGNWTASLTPTVPTVFAVVDGRGLSSAGAVVYPVSGAAASSPQSGYAGRSVVVRGNAGNAPVPVTVSVLQPGGSWTKVRTVTPAANGGFNASVPLADAPGQTAQWRVATGYGPAVMGSVTIEPTFAPTVTGPRRTAWRAVHPLTGTAVPGDTVTIWTAAPGTAVDAPGWTSRGTVAAAADDSWTFPLRFTRDTAWRVTSPSGDSAAGVTVVVPTITAPSTVVARAPFELSGRSIPGGQLTLYQRPAGTSAWIAGPALTVAADGSWSLRRRLRASTDYRVVGNGQTSRAVSVTVE